MKKRTSLWKSITMFALVFAMVAGIMAGYKGKAKAANTPGIYTITFNGGYVYDTNGVRKNGTVKKPNGTWVTSYSTQYGAGANMGFPSAKNGDYELLGWATKQNGPVVYKPGEVIHAGGNNTYYAVWKTIMVSYYVPYDGCYPLTPKKYIYDRNADSIADSQGFDYGVGGKSSLAKADRVVLGYSKYWRWTEFLGWKGTNRYGQEINVTGLTVQQALNKLGYPNDTDLYLTAIISGVKR